VDYQAIPGRFGGYSTSTKQYFVYIPLARPLSRSRDVVYTEGKLYSTLHAADDAFLNQHFYRDVIKEPIPIENQPTECQTKESLENGLPPEPTNRKKMSLELDGFECSLGGAWKPPAEGSHPNHPCNLAESAQVALEDDEFEDMVSICSPMAISGDHEDHIDDPKSYEALNESPLAKQWHTAVKQSYMRLVSIKSLEISQSIQTGERLF
jgi:hypothetical protein